MRTQPAALLALVMIALIAALPAAPARAWGNLLAHPQINTRALGRFEAAYAKSPKYERAPIDHSLLLRGMGVVTPGKLNVSDEPLTLDVTGWVEHGGFSADEPEAFAALRHFYDPIGANGGAHYLTDQVPDSSFPNPQIDARIWAIDHPENPHSWQRALQIYKLAMESPRDREANLAYAFRSLGETMHLLADMSQPAHVRNDSHLFDEPVEDTVDATIVNRYAAAPLDSRFHLQATSASALIDSVARYANFNFFSSDTIYNPADPLALPRNGETPYDSPSFSALTFKDAEYTYYATFDVGEVPMAQWTYSAYMLDLLHAPGARGFHVPTTFADRQASVLIPLAVQSNVLLLDMFFPTLSLTLSPGLNADGQVQYGGELTHQLERDQAWQPEQGGPGTISYTGAGQLYRLRGRETKLLAELQFVAGKVREPVVIDQRAAGLRADDRLFLEVRAGGRVIRSPELPLAGPQIITLDPAQGKAGTVVTIRGRAFGAEQGRSSVTFAGRSGSVQTWSDTEIVAVAPEGVRNGPVVVSVQGLDSNGVRFSVAGEPITPAAEPPDSGSPKLCFAVEPLDPNIPPPWLMPSMSEGAPGIGWACIIGDQVYAKDVPIHTSCAPPDEVKVFPSFMADYDGVSSFSNANGSVRGTYSPSGITMIVQYSEIRTSTGECPGGEAVIVFDQ